MEKKVLKLIIKKKKKYMKTSDHCADGAEYIFEYQG